MAQVALGKGRGFQNLLSGYVLPDEDATMLLPHRDGLLNNRRNRRLSDTALLAVFRAKPGWDAPVACHLDASDSWNASKLADDSKEGVLIFL